VAIGIVDIQAEFQCLLGSDDAETVKSMLEKPQKRS
jgi:hypothetical protein